MSGQEHDHHRHRGGPRQFFTNWREYDAPLPTKLRLTVRNRWRIIAQFKWCCGHPGEPGC